jgi:hypothetical protein
MAMPLPTSCPIGSNAYVQLLTAKEHASTLTAMLMMLPPDIMACCLSNAGSGSTADSKVCLITATRSVYLCESACRALCCSSCVLAAARDIAQWSGSLTDSYMWACLRWHVSAESWIVKARNFMSSSEPKGSIDLPMFTLLHRKLHLSA